MPDPSSVPVHSVGFGWVAALVALLNVLVGGALVAAIKNAPKLRELANTRRRDDLDDMRQRIADLEKKAEAAFEVAHKAEMKLVYAVSAIQLLAARIRADNPDDPTLKQASELLAAATAGGLSEWAERLSGGISKMKGKD